MFLFSEKAFNLNLTLKSGYTLRRFGQREGRRDRQNVGCGEERGAEGKRRKRRRECCL